MVGAAPFTLSDYPGFLPGLAVSVLLATAVHRYVARRLAIGGPVAWLLVMSFCGIIAATLTPGVEALPPVSGKASCEFSRIGPAPLADYMAMGTTGLNVLLFVPLGVVIARLPRSRVMVLAVIGACLLPAMIEAIQLAVLPLGRACQVGDVVDNTIGLALGFAAGSTGVWISRRASKQPQHGMAPPG